jgi:hypothetical protein
LVIGGKKVAIPTENTASFNVAAPEPHQIASLKEFLAGMASDLQEECVYFRADSRASLIYPQK